MLGSLGWFIVVLFGLIGLFILICIPHNVRIWRVGRIYRRLPPQVVSDILALIEHAAAHGPSVTFLRLSEEEGNDDTALLKSHVGGLPYAEAGDEWPQGTPEGEPAKFLLQVRIGEPSLGEQWQGRLIVAFLVFDFEQVVRSYSPSVDRYVPLENKRPPRPSIRFRHIRMPVASVEERVPMSPGALVEAVPEIGTLLRPYTSDFAGVLTQVLRPNFYGYNLGAPEIAYVGGDPVFIQEPLEPPQCSRCGRPMRFLLQFGEVMPDLKMADAGVYSVYGCDDHPEQCRGFVDMH